MKTLKLLNYERDRWIAGDGNLAEIPSAIDGAPVAMTGSGGLDFGGMLRHAREVGGPALRKLTFHERARMIKALGLAIMARKEELYELNYLTGATRKDGWIDIEGGAGTLFSFSSKGRRELPDAHVLLDGQLEGLSKNGTFVGQHIYTPLQGAAVHINAFNFPVWGMLEKLAPTLLAGVPAIVKPASATAYLTEAAFKIMIEADVLPPGAIQLIVGGVGDLFDHLTGQDVVSFTGSAHDRAEAPVRIRPSCAKSVRFVAEQDSLNASLLGPDAAPGHARVRPVHQGSRDRDDRQGGAEMHRHPPRDGARPSISTRSSRRSASGWRRPRSAIRAPRTRAWARSSASASATTFARRSRELEAAGARIVAGDPNAEPPIAGGAFLPPVLLRTDDPWGHGAVHDCEPFGPVSTIMPYKDIGDAIALANRGRGSLALSLFTHSPDAAREFVQGAAAYHGRMLVLDRANAAEIDRPRLAAACARPRRPRPRRRKRGDGRRARRQALHAAHRDPVVAGDDRRDHRAIYPRRAQACHRQSTRSAEG